jgi:hypothetical protein
VHTLDLAYIYVTPAVSGVLFLVIDHYNNIKEIMMLRFMMSCSHHSDFLCMFCYTNLVLSIAVESDLYITNM